MKKLLAVFICILFLLSSVGFASSIKVSSNEEYKDLKEKLKTAETNVETTKEAWQQASSSEKFDKLKENWKAIVELAKARLDFLKVTVELNENIEQSLKSEMTEEIDGLQSRLDDLLPEIDAMENMLDALSVVGKFLEIWADFIWEAKKYYGLTVASQIDKVIEKGEGLKTLMSSKIDLLENQGKDVAELQDIYDDYKQRLDTITQKNADAKAKLREIDKWQGHNALFLEAAQLVADEMREARYALKNLKEFSDKLREMGVIVGIGTGSVYAKGSGIADISGDGKLVLQSFSDPDGELTVWDYAGDASIDVNYEGEKTDNADGSVTYEKVTSADIQGSDVRVLAEGDGYALMASGTGQATLIGAGYYHFGDEDKKIEFENTATDAAEVPLVEVEE